MTTKIPNMGRQKIRMVKIEKKNHLQVTFSKRRNGLFKKASELCTLCGVDVAIVVFSPGNKVFSFGHPQVESIADRFLDLNSNGSSTTTHRLIEAHRNANINELNLQLTHLVEQLETERKNGEALDRIMKAGRNLRWWEAPIDELGLNELERLGVAVEELKKKVVKQAVLVESANNNNHWKFLEDNGIGLVNSFDQNKFNDETYGYGNRLF